MDFDKYTLVALRVSQDWSLSLEVSAAVGLILAAIAVGLFVWRCCFQSSWADFEIDNAELGVGNGKVTFKPNMTDRQVAYSIWVELSTRKIGLTIDFDHDVVVEVYDSWYAFFGVTRELIKSVPVTKVRGDSTQKIVNLSIEVLNEGLRPHLTKWQARFRRWYEGEMSKLPPGTDIDPQDIQKKFPKWAELKADMEQVNKHLISYRRKMNALVHSG